MGCSASVTMATGSLASLTGKRDVHSIFSEHQIQVLRKTWKVLLDDMTAHGSKVFLRIVEINPELKQLFPFRNISGKDLLNDSRFKGHASRFMQSIGAAIDNIENLDSTLAPVLINLGGQHIAYLGNHGENFEIFAEAMLYVWKLELKEKYTPEVEEAWTTVFDYIIEKLKYGYKHKTSKTSEHRLK